MNNLRRFFLIVMLVALPPGAAAFAQTSTPTPTATPDYRTFMEVGAIEMHAGTAGTGWLVCDGSAVSRTTYARLFSVIGISFGNGDGTTTFNLPDLRGRAPIGSGTGPGLTARSVGQPLGNETHTLTVTEMPSHNHGVTDPGHTHVIEHSNGVVGGGVMRWSGNLTGQLNPNGNTLSSTTGITINNTGGGAAFGIMDPSLVVNYYIWAGTVAMPAIVAEETIVITVVVVFPTHTPTPTPTSTITPTPGATPTPTATASPTVSTSVSYSVGSQAVMMDYTVRPGDAMTVAVLVVIAVILLVLSYMYFKRSGS
ncbi:MAG TPA: tail fiber protein [Terriglobales bacterium]|nr:tail fiber protein [Terriglobales bacterium]